MNRARFLILAAAALPLVVTAPLRAATLQPPPPPEVVEDINADTDGGTPGKTNKTKDADPVRLTVSDGWVYFSAVNVTAGKEKRGRTPWVYLGGTATRIGLCGVAPDADNCRRLTVLTRQVDGKTRRELFLLAKDTPGSERLWRIEGVAADCSPVEIQPPPKQIFDLAVAEAALYFADATSGQHVEIRRIYGGNVQLLATSSGKVSDVRDLTDCGLGTADGFLACTGTTGGSRGLHVFFHDYQGSGSAAIVPVATEPDPQDLIAIGDRLYFTTPGGGGKLWSYTRGSGLEPIAAVVGPRLLTAVSTSLYAVAGNADLYRVDGASATAVPAADSGKVPARMTGLVAFDGTLYFAAYHAGTQKTWLWKVEAGQSEQVVPIVVSSERVSNVRELVAGDLDGSGYLVFLGGYDDMGSTATGLFVYADGSLESCEIEDFVARDNTDHLTVVGDTVLFTGKHANLGIELWRCVLPAAASAMVPSGQDPGKPSTGRLGRTP